MPLDSIVVKGAREHNLKNIPPESDKCQYPPDIYIGRSNDENPSPY